MKRMKKRIRRGIALVWTAVGAIVFIGFLGLSIDLGYIYLVSGQLQAATDAAALGAARAVREDIENAREIAVNTASLNRAAGEPVTIDPNEDNAVTGDIVIGFYDRDERTFTPTLVNPNAVRVTARRTAGSPGGQVPLFFGGIFGVPGANVSRTATAMIGGGTGSGMVGLGEGRCILHLSGNVTVIVEDGGIHLNTLAPECAVCVSGSSYTLEADEISTAGGTVCADNYKGPVNTNAGIKPDPLEWLEGPLTPYAGPIFPDQVVIQNSGTYVLEPGYYQQGIKISGNKDNVRVTFLPGIYVIGKQGQGGGQTPPGLDFSGGTITAKGVMFYIDEGSVNFTAGANITMEPPDPAEHLFPGANYYEHISIFQSRSNTMPASIGGGPGLNLKGTLYFPKAELSLAGTGEGSFGNQIVAQRYRLSGSGDIDINYTGAFMAAGNTVFLVR